MTKKLSICCIIALLFLAVSSMVTARSPFEGENAEDFDAVASVRAGTCVRDFPGCATRCAELAKLVAEKDRLENEEEILENEAAAKMMMSLSRKWEESATEILVILACYVVAACSAMYFASGVWAWIRYRQVNAAALLEQEEEEEEEEEEEAAAAAQHIQNLDDQPRAIHRTRAYVRRWLGLPATHTYWMRYIWDRMPLWRPLVVVAVVFFFFGVLLQQFTMLLPEKLNLATQEQQRLAKLKQAAERSATRKESSSWWALFSRSTADAATWVFGLLGELVGAPAIAAVLAILASLCLFVFVAWLISQIIEATREPALEDIQGAAIAEAVEAFVAESAAQDFRDAAAVAPDLAAALGAMSDAELRAIDAAGHEARDVSQQRQRRSPGAANDDDDAGRSPSPSPVQPAPAASPKAAGKRSNSKPGGKRSKSRTTKKENS